MVRSDPAINREAATMPHCDPDSPDFILVALSNLCSPSTPQRRPQTLHRTLSISHPILSSTATTHFTIYTPLLRLLQEKKNLGNLNINYASLKSKLSLILIMEWKAFPLLRNLEYHQKCGTVLGREQSKGIKH